MASLPMLVKRYAELAGRPQKETEWTGRKAREGGKISSGKRGRGASQMTPSDVVSLIFAANCADEAIQGPVVIDQMKSLIRSSDVDFTWAFKTPFARLLSARTLENAIQAVMTDHDIIQAAFDEAFSSTQPDFEPEQIADHLDQNLGLDLTIWKYGAEIEGWDARGGKRKTFLKATYHRDVMKMRRGFYQPEPSKYAVTKTTLSFRMIYELSILIFPKEPIRDSDASD